MKLAKKINMILCDDIRTETGNKTSLIGVYGNNIIVNQVPFILPKICLYVMLTKTNKPIPGFDVTVVIPKTDPIKLNIPEPPGQIIGSDVSLGIVISPLKLKAAGNARIEIRFENEKRPSLIHRFKIALPSKEK